MSIKILIDDIRKAAHAAGAKTSMARGRDLVSKILFDRNYSAAVASERDGKLPQPEIVQLRVEKLRMDYGKHVDIIVGVAAGALEVTDPSFPEEPQMIMTATTALATQRLPSFPPLDAHEVQTISDRAKKRDQIDWIRLRPDNTRRGKHLNFFRVGRHWYAMVNRMYETGEAYLTATLDECVIHLLEDGDVEDSHKFLCHVFENGNWDLDMVEHLIVDPEDFDLTWEELTDPW